MHEDGLKKTLGVLFLIGGNLWAYAQNIDLGAIISAVGAVGMAAVGVYSYFSQQRAKTLRENLKIYAETEVAKLEAWKADQRAKIDLEVERDTRLGHLLTRKLEDAEQDRDDMRAQLERLTVIAESTGRELRDIKAKVQNRPRVLIVEDSADFAKSTSRLLKSAGYESDFAESLQAARVKLKRSPVWVLIDINLPDGSGLELLAEIKRDSLKIKVCLMPSVITDALEFAKLKWTPDAVVPKGEGFDMRLAHALNDPTAPRPHLSDLDLPRISGDEIPVAR